LPDSVRHQEARVTAIGDQLSQTGRRNFQLGYGVNINRPGQRVVQFTDPCGAAIDQQLTQRSQARRAPAGPVGDDDMGQVKNLAPLIPLRQTEKYVHAHDQAQRAAGKFGAQFAECIDRVGRALPPDLAVIDDKAMLRLGGDPDHGQPMRSAGDRRLAVRRYATGHETKFGQAQGLDEFERRAQVPVMDRVEGAAKNSDRVHAAFPSGLPAIALRIAANSAQASPGS